jgi:hypothetical protein
MESFSPTYRLQDKDLNISFYAQGIAYPPDLTYLYTPYFVSYEISYIDPDKGPIIVGPRDRQPVLVKSGTYRANMVIDDSWASGDYQILWKFKVSEEADIEYSADIFEVNGLGVHEAQFILILCSRDLPAIFNVLQEAQDLPASFDIIP